MLILIPGLLALRARLDDPLKALRTTLEAAPGITARVTSGGAVGTLEVDRSGAVRVVTEDQRVVHGVEGDWEFDDRAKQYDFMPRAAPIDASAVGTGRVADAARSLLVPVLARLGPHSALRTSAFRKEGAGYVTGTKGQATLTLMFGKDGAAEGRLVRVRFESPDGSQEWGISGLKAATFAPANFRPTVAPGYVEAFEPRLAEAAQPGTPLPPRLRALAPKAGEPWLLAFTGDDAAARAWLGTTGLPVALAQASEAERRALKVVAYPTYLVVGAEGKIRGVWQGYSPEMRAELVREWRAALKAAKAPH